MFPIRLRPRVTTYEAYKVSFRGTVHSSGRSGEDCREPAYDFKLPSPVGSSAGSKLRVVYRAGSKGHLHHACRHESQIVATFPILPNVLSRAGLWLFDVNPARTSRVPDHVGSDTCYLRRA